MVECFVFLRPLGLRLGHINDCDGTNQAVFKALVREMNEELNIEPNSPFKFIGYMRDLTSETSEHFGLVFIIKSEEDSISIKETDKSDRRHVVL